MRTTLGIAVFSGMLGVTIFGIFLTPVFYYVIQWLSGATASVPQGNGTSPVPGDLAAGKKADSPIG